MKYSDFINDFNSTFAADRLLQGELMRNHTTWRVGGPADLFFSVKNEDELVRTILLARKYAIPFFILGGGANILVGDKGIRGLVVKNEYETAELIGDEAGTPEQREVYKKIMDDWKDHSTGVYRHMSVHYNFYDDDKNPSYRAKNIFVSVSSGYSMPHFIRDAVRNGWTGLEWFARIPGTMGGWIYNNVHGHTAFIGDFIYTAKILKENGEIIEVSWKDLDFGYDYSIFHTNKDVILSTVIRLYKGNVELAKEVIKDVIVKKNLRQPANSAGCVFHNITEEEAQKNGFESNAIGYVIDKKLGLLGQHRVGGAWISEKHGDFIETDGTATAQDVLAVMKFMQDICKEKYNLELKSEIFMIGEF